MYRFIVILLLFSGVFGCGSDGESGPDRSSDITESSEHFDLNHPFNYSIADRVEDLWETAKLCSGIYIGSDYERLQIDYTEDYFVDPPSKAYGMIWPAQNYARVWHGDLKYFTGEITIHEFIHYLLYLSGQPDNNHESSLFKQCAPNAGTNS